MKHNGFHIGMNFKNDHADLYSVQWLKNGIIRFFFPESVEKVG